jgi:hypothetical protein
MKKGNETRPGSGEPSPETDELFLREAFSPYKVRAWQELTPAERLRRSWAMRSRLTDPQAVHDRKLFPKP